MTGEDTLYNGSEGNVIPNAPLTAIPNAPLTVISNAPTVIPKVPLTVIPNAPSLSFRGAYDEESKISL